MRKKIFLKYFALTMAFAMVNQILFPLTAKALTSGPTQPEVQQFEQIGSSDMVDLFTGDFSYNIPLLNVGGYPVNLSYKSGVGTDDEASWVGLGWNLNVGAITRNMRGIPDEFRGDEETIFQESYRKPNKTWGLNLGPSIEFVGKEVNGIEVEKNKKPQIGFDMGLFYNNYKGYGVEYGIDMGLNAGKNAKVPYTAGLGLAANSQEGSTVKPSLNYQLDFVDNEKKKIGVGLGLNTSINSRSGMKAINLGASPSINSEKFRAGTQAMAMKYAFAAPAYMPQGRFPIRNTSYNLNIKIGGEVAYTTISGNLRGYISTQKQLYYKKDFPAYGYLHHHLAASDEDENGQYLMDFNREKDGYFNQFTPNLPLAQQTYDTYAISGQGVAGVFRSYRGDIGHVYDPQTKVGGNSFGGGFQGNLGGVFAVGGNINYTRTVAKSRAWASDDGNDVAKSTDFDPAASDRYYEHAGFRMAGEMTPADQAYFHEMGEFANVRAALGKSGSGNTFDVHTKQNGWTFDNNEGIDQNFAQAGNPVQRNQRKVGNTMISVLSAKEADKLALEKKILNYTQGSLAPGLIDRVPSNPSASTAKAHHPSEVKVTQSDGSRYVYGIPAYQKIQRDVSFSAGSAVPNAIPESAKPDGFVTYPQSLATSIHSPADDIRRGEGLDQMFSSSQTPAYAHAHLLTAYLSDDYEDQTLDGPTPDDLGAYVKFNYDKVHDDFKWRMPMQHHSARQNRGFRQDPTDDVLSYSYGEKEVWYLHSIETRDYVAVFDTEDRKDAFGVQGEEGGIDTGHSLKKLKEIRLYDRRDYLANGNSIDPIKAIHFEYDYELCQGVPNNSGIAANGTTEQANQGGKLTLKKIYFTHYGSERGKLNAYNFDYNNTIGGTVPQYNLRANDRWGTYAPQTTNADLEDNADFPYTTQDPVEAAERAALWNLSRIDLPSGGHMEVSYESDDYAYVQNKEAMHMYRIKELRKGDENGPTIQSPVSGGMADLYDDALGEEYNYLIFDLDQPIPTNLNLNGRDAEAHFFDKYIKNIGNYLKFKALIDLKGNPTSSPQGEHKEYVEGYARLTNGENDAVDAGLMPGTSGNHIQGWIKVELESRNDRVPSNENKYVHPFAKAAWQMTRLQQANVVYPSSVYTAPDPNKSDEEQLKALVPRWPNLFEIFKNENSYMRRKGFAQEIKLEHSWIRLPDGNQTKFGGGSRVKKVEIFDGWDQLSQDRFGNPIQNEANYGQEYSYTLEEEGRTISSGVASYEPLIGGDENPFRQPAPYTVKNTLALNGEHYQEEPMGESLFPAAGVGYRRVTVTNLKRIKNGENVVKKHGAGYAVHEFYTAKEYPTITKKSNLGRKRSTSKFVASFLGIPVRDQAAYAQGFTVIRNDMHGKPKSTWALPEGAEYVGQNPQRYAISGSKYIYRDVADKNSNKVLALSPDGSVDEILLGVSADLVTDSRNSRSRITAPSFAVQTDVAPWPGPSFWPGLSSEVTEFKSMVATKVIDVKGILDRVETYDREAMIPKENVLWDAVTGGVLLTRTQTEFKQNIYDFGYPAHWVYDTGMGQGYRTNGMEVVGAANTPINYPQGQTGNPGLHIPGSLGGVSGFQVGDKISLTRSSGLGIVYPPYWVVEVDQPGNRLFLIDEAGDTPIQAVSYTGTFAIKVLRPAARNMHSAGIGSIRTSKSPLTISAGNAAFDLASVEDYILESGAVEYSEDWKMFCVKDAPPTGGGFCIFNWASAFSILSTYNAGLLESPVSVGNGVTYTSVLSGGSSNASIQGTFTDCNGNIVGSFNAAIPGFYDPNNGCNGSLDPQSVSVTPNTSNPNASDISFYIGCGTQAPVWISFTGQCPDNCVIIGGGGCDLAAFFTPTGFVLGVPGPNNSITHTYASGFVFQWTVVQGSGSQGFDQMSGTVFDCNGNALGSFNANPSYSNGTIVCNTPLINLIQVQPVPNSNQYTLEFRISCERWDPFNVIFTVDCPVGCIANGNRLANTGDCDQVTDAVNPFVEGLQGHWRPKRNYAYLAERKYVDNGQPRLREDGVYKAYDPFWKRVSNAWTDDGNQYKEWQHVSEATVYHPRGMEVESADAIGNHSAAILGYDQSLVVATGQNVRYNELAFESFEDYVLRDANATCELFHWDFIEADPDNITDQEAHSGFRSLQVGGNPMIVVSDVDDQCGNPGQVNSDKYYELACGDCMDLFEPTTVDPHGDAQKYVLYAWAKQSSNGQMQPLSYALPQIMVAFDNANGVIFQPTGKIIDGWQRIEGEFTIPVGTDEISVWFQNNASSQGPVYFDDVRIAPYDAGVTTYVYHPFNRRLMAELDANHYSTFYEYDEDGSLIRVKKETERGILTLNEARTSLVKQ